MYGNNKELESLMNIVQDFFAHIDEVALYRNLINERRGKLDGSETFPHAVLFLTKYTLKQLKLSHYYYS